MIVGVVATWAAYTFFVHTVIGQRFVVAPLLASKDGTPFSRATLEVVWHATTLLLAGIVAFILWPANSSAKETLLDVAGIQALAVACVFLVIGPLRMGSGLALPQWILLGSAGRCPVAC